jgi:predicted alpha/beta superfamily hydrolase
MMSSPSVWWWTRIAVKQEEHLEAEKEKSGNLHTYYAP